MSTFFYSHPHVSAHIKWCKNDDKKMTKCYKAHSGKEMKNYKSCY